MRNVPFLYYPYQVYKFIFYIPMLAFTAFLGTLLIVILSPLFREKPGRYIGKAWGKINAWTTPMFVATRGFENIEPKQSYIIVANHQSLFDIFVLYGWLPVDFRWVMKAELRKVPFLGYFCHVAGHVFVNRQNPAEAVEAINNARKNITGGTCIVFFPEGTRSYDGRLLPFKKGAFKFALDMGLPVLPVSIDGTRNILPNNTLSLFPGRTRLIVHPPIPIKGFSEKSIASLMDRTREAIESGIRLD